MKAVQALRETRKTALTEEERVRALIRSDATPKALNIGNQNKHILESKGYIAGRSYIYGTLEDAQALVTQYHGTGEIRFDQKGNWVHKEIIVLDRDIGTHISDVGVEDATNAFTIHYGKKGTHIVPTTRRDPK